MQRNVLLQCAKILLGKGYEFAELKLRVRTISPPLLAVVQTHHNTQQSELKVRPHHVHGSSATHSLDGDASQSAGFRFFYFLSALCRQWSAACTSKIDM